MKANGPDEKRQWVLATLEAVEAPLTRYAARLLGCEDSARDAVQHAFLRLCDQSPDALGDGVRPWLFRVCRNKAIDMLRQSRRTTSMENEESLGSTSREIDPAAAAERRDLYGRVNRLIERLPAGQREAIDLWAEGFTYREIAEVTSHTEGNVRVLVCRGLKRLRQDRATAELLGATSGTRRC